MEGGQNSDMTLPFISDSILEKQESDKSSRKTSAANERVFIHAHTGESYTEHRCSVTQTVFNGTVIYLTNCHLSIFLCVVFLLRHCINPLSFLLILT